MPLLDRVGALLKKEVQCLCSEKVSQLLTNLPKLSEFSWINYLEVIKSHAPFIVNLLLMILSGKKKKNEDVNRITGLIISIITCFKRNSLNIVQKIVSILLYAGHCSKEVMNLLLFPYNESYFLCYIIGL